MLGGDKRDLKLPQGFTTELSRRFEDKIPWTDDYELYRISAPTADMMNQYLETTELLYPLTCIKTQTKEIRQEERL